MNSEDIDAIIPGIYHLHITHLGGLLALIFKILSALLKGKEVDID